MSEDRNAFGLRLKRQREDRGVTLQAIAESTKIKQSLLAALERGEVSQWPQGLFRRAYIRDYASAIGLPAQSIIAEFARLFPEKDNVSDVGEIAKAQLSKDRPRLHHSSLQDLPFAWRLNHVRAAIFDLAVVFLICGLLAGLTGLTLWTIVGVVSVCYCTVGTVWFGQSMGSCVLKRTDRLFRRMPDDRPSDAQSRQRLSVLQGKPQHPDVQRERAERSEKTPRRASA
jgi:transcriptional regulator with XRE-family HTH domain